MSVFFYRCRACAPDSCSCEHGFSGKKDRNPPNTCVYNKRETAWELVSVYEEKPEEPETNEIKTLGYLFSENRQHTDYDFFVENLHREMQPFMCLLDKTRRCHMKCKHLKIREDYVELCCKPIHTKIELDAR